MEDNTSTFEGLRTRLGEIVELVDDPATSLDDALTLYEEAIKLGIAACDLSEVGIIEEAESAPDADPDNVEDSSSKDADATMQESDLTYETTSQSDVLQSIEEQPSDAVSVEEISIEEPAGSQAL